MDQQSKSSASRRKVRFAPTSSPARKPKPSTTKTEVGDEEDGESAQAQALLRRLNENLARRGPKVEKKSAVKVAFGPGASSSPSLRTYGVVNNGKSSSSASVVSVNKQNALTLPSTAIENQSDACMIDATDDATDASAGKIKRDYKEPWDYQHTYYPTTLPLRKPYSGDPELLDEAEFGEAATSTEYDENCVNPAAELGLLEESEQQRMLFFQLPELPLVKQPVSRKGKEKVGTSTASRGSIKGCTLGELAGGYMGKMLVYKSGAIKLRLGDALYDVSPGSDCIFAQDVVAMNTEEKHCCVLGELGKRAVVTPDIDSIELL